MLVECDILATFATEGEHFPDQVFLTLRIIPSVARETRGTYKACNLQEEFLHYGNNKENRESETGEHKIEERAPSSEP